MPNLGGDNGKDSVASRKLAAAELRKARKAARESPRSRLLSDSSDELPKGILKNFNSNRTSMIPTKRSVSECVDDLSQIMDQLDLNIHDFPKANRRFCPRHQYFNEEEEEDDDEEDEDNDDDNDDDDDDDDDYEEDDGEEDEEEGENDHKEKHERAEDDEKEEQKSGDKKHDKQQQLNKKCDCNSSDVKPKKSVRFDERVYETVFFASKLYDRRYFAKYHFSSRHHPKNSSNNHSNKKKNRSKSESKDEVSASNLYGKLTKSQRAKQSKKDKKKKRELSKKENHNEGTDTSNNDDQGYCSSFHSFSD